MKFSQFLISSLLFMLDFHLSHCKLLKAPAEDLDYVRPELNPFQNLKLKNSADLLVPGRKGERKGSLHDVDIVPPPALKKTKKAKDILLRAASLPHVGYLDSNSMLGAQSGAKKDISSVRVSANGVNKYPSGAAKPSGPGGSARAGDSKTKRPETEAQRAERINKQFEKMLQFTALLGHVDSFLYDRTKSVVRTLHHMMGDSREMLDADFDTNELRRRRQSSDLYRAEPKEHRVPSAYQHWAPSSPQADDSDYYDERYSGTLNKIKSSP